jgi:transposase-like protein
VCKATPKGVRAGLKGGAGREAQLPSAPEARLNREIERRACSVGVFPSKASAIRLIGSVLTEENECSLTQRKSYYG